MFDGGQLTLMLNPDIFGTNISGRKEGSRIQLQWVGEKGSVASAEYVPGSQEQFARYANQLKGKAGSIVLNSGLATGARKLTEAVNSAEQWMSNAQVHAQRIPNARAMYQQIESRMRTLLVREHSTANSVARSQISVMVNQGDIAGNQVDIDVDQVWDSPWEPKDPVSGRLWLATAHSVNPGRIWTSTEHRPMPKEHGETRVTRLGMSRTNSSLYTSRSWSSETTSGNFRPRKRRIGQH
jgi:hypothetical protein